MSCLSRRFLIAIAFVSVMTQIASAEQKPVEAKNGQEAEGGKLDQAELEKKFAEKMSGVVFSGHYSVDAAAGPPPQMEKYTISKAAKVKNDFWLLTARMQYGGTDIELPMMLQVKWAGDTPMITLTDLTIPGLGTFTSRVLIYDDRYAGTWQHGKSGGHLWGKLAKAEPKSEPKPAEPSKAEPSPKPTPAKQN